MTRTPTSLPRPRALRWFPVFAAALAAFISFTLPLRGADSFRQHVSLNADWHFNKGDASNAAAPDFADGSWETVSVPHTWNAKDGQDGGNNYYRGEAWYRRHVAVGDELKGRSLFLRFEGINRKAEIYVNGALLGSHAGGHSTIVLDATKALKPGDNVIAVKVSNRIDQSMAPIQADFTFFGGIYRPAELIAVSPLHISLTDLGSPGVYITTPQVTDTSATVHVRAVIHATEQTTASPAKAEISIADASGKVVARQQVNIPAAGEAREAVADLTVANPHRWNGRADPYLYSVTVTVTGASPDLTDSVTQPLGIRTYAVDPAKGFILNGKPYDVHGVNRHQERQDKGWALSNEDHLEDMALIKELGCTGIRLAHYQHAQFFYDLCDKEGMVVWAEIPVVDKLGAGPDFTENARQQYEELIRQNFNHPSIFFWSAGNEVDESGGNFNRNGPAVYPWFKELAALGKREDPSRLTASAWREKFFPPVGTTDVMGLNEYLGWYTGGGPENNEGWQGLEDYIAAHSDPAKGGWKGMWGMTEYGAGASILFHSEKPVRMDHSEEYQAMLHEKTWQVFSRHPELWCKFVWAMFDFAVDNRAEGDHAGINDKGLVTHDRKTRKDAFYFYKAVWADTPTLWITSKRFTVRGVEKIPVKVYTNAPRVTLTVNGTSLGEKAVENGTALWDQVSLRQGANEVVATATGRDGKPLRDTCTWTYTPGAPTEVYPAQDERMTKALQAGAPRAPKK
jgi:beta-galactosidase